MIKECTKCKEGKEESEFFFRNKLKNKRHSQCKECYRKSRSNKEHYLKNKSSYIKRAKKRQEKIIKENRIKLINYLLKNPCNTCGESDPIVLEFNHIDRTNKKYSISKMMRDYAWSKILIEISKCEVLCANCHKRVTAKQFDWYKIK